MVPRRLRRRDTMSSSTVLGHNYSNSSELLKYSRKSIILKSFQFSCLSFYANLAG